VEPPGFEPTPEVRARWERAEAHLPDFVGMSISDAEAYAVELDLHLRVLAPGQPRRADLRPDRINAEHDEAGVIVRTWRG
jgi:hypothetical protein